MLDDAAWPEQDAADGADVGLGGAAKHFFQPPGVQRLNAASHREQELALGMRCAVVDQSREAEPTGEGRHPHAVGRDFGEVAQRLRIRSIVVDDNHFVAI